MICDDFGVWMMQNAGELRTMLLLHTKVHAEVYQELIKEEIAKMI